MAEARVLYGGQGGSLLYGGGSFLYGGGSWRPVIPSLLGGEYLEQYLLYIFFKAPSQLTTISKLSLLKNTLLYVLQNQLFF